MSDFIRVSVRRRLLVVGVGLSLLLTLAQFPAADLPRAAASEVALTTNRPIAISPTADVAYIAVAGEVKKVTLNTESVQSITTLVGAAAGTDCDATTIKALAITTDGTTLYAGTYNCIFRVDLGTLVQTRIPIAWFDWAVDIVATPNSVFALSGSAAGKIVKIDKVAGVWGATYTQIRDVQGGGYGVDLAVPDDGAYVYVALNGGDAECFQTAAPTTTRTGFPNTANADALQISHGGRNLLIATGATATLKKLTIDQASRCTSTSTTSQSLSPLQRAQAIAFEPASEYAYVASQNRYISRVRISDLVTTGTYTVSGSGAMVAALAQPNTGPDRLVATTGTSIAVFPVAPNAPTGLSASGRAASALVSFTAGNNGFGTIVNYEYELAGSGNWIGLSPARTTSPVTVPDLTPNQAVTIKLRAVSAAGAGAASASVSVTPLAVPAFPTNLVATPGLGQASIAFTPGANGGASITNYEYRVNGTGAWIARSPASTTSPMTVTGLVNDVASTIELRAVSSLGAGAASAPVTVTPRSLAVTYNANQATTGTAPVDGASPYGPYATAAVSANTGSLARTGYTFAGWNSQADGLGTTYSVGSSFTVSASTVLYALWQPVADARILPGAVSLGSQSVLAGAGNSRVITVSNAGAGAFTVDAQGIAVTGTDSADFVVTGGTCAAGGTVAGFSSCTVAVAFDPTVTGAKSATLAVATSSASGARSLSSALSGLATGSEQVVDWSPTTAIDTATTTPSELATTTTGGGPITYAVSSAGTTGCAVDPGTGALAFTGAGTCVVVANAAATSVYAAAAKSVTFTVSRTAQSIVASAARDQLPVFGTTQLSASGRQGNGPISYDVTSGQSNCSITGTVLTATAVGTCMVTATVAADAHYAAATSAPITVTVEPAPQSVSWAPMNAATTVTSAPLRPSVLAATDGDGAITYSVVVGASTTSDCGVSASTGVLSFGTPGTCLVRASAAATTTYAQGVREVTFTIAAVAPNPPTITGVGAGDGAVTITYAAPTFSGGSAITGYVATASTGQTVSCASSPCTLGGLANGSAVTVTMQAINAIGTSAASAASPSVTPSAALGAVQELAVTPGDQLIDIAWQPPACLLAAPSTCGTFVSYDVEVSPIGGYYSRVAFITSSAANTKISVTGLQNGNRYSVRVTTTTSTGSALAAASQIPATVPTAPTDVRNARLSGTSVSIGWTRPAVDGGAAIIDYTVTAMSSDGGATVAATCGSSPCVLTGLTDGKTYAVTVRARNSVGTGSASTASNPFVMGVEAQSIAAVPSALTVTVGASVVLGASGTSGSGGKTFAVVSGPCVVTAGVVTATGVGDCVVTASIAADDIHGAATSSTVTITVVRAPQAVSWVPTSVFTTVDSGAVLNAGTASGGGTVMYAVVSAGTADCALGSARTLTFTGAGTCTLRASAAQTSTYESATGDLVTVSVSLAERQVVWAPNSTLVATDDGQAPSALPSLSAGTGAIDISVLDPGATGCVLDATSAALSFTGPGACVVQAAAAANATYARAATAVTFTVAEAPQGVVWPLMTSYSADASPVAAGTAIGTGGGSITYTVVSGTMCAIDPIIGGLTFSRAGACVLRATAAAVSGFAAGSFTRAITITAAPSSGSAVGSGVGSAAIAVRPSSTSHAAVGGPAVEAGAAVPTTHVVSGKPLERLRVVFGYRSTVLSTRAKHALNRLVARYSTGPAPTTMTVGLVRPKATRADNRIARLRARNVATYLRAARLPGSVVLKSNAVTRLRNAKARGVVVTVWREGDFPASQNAAASV